MLCGGFHRAVDVSGGRKTESDSEEGGTPNLTLQERAEAELALHEAEMADMKAQLAAIQTEKQIVEVRADPLYGGTHSDQSSQNSRWGSSLTLVGGAGPTDSRAEAHRGRGVALEFPAIHDHGVHTIFV